VKCLTKLSKVVKELFLYIICVLYKVASFVIFSIVFMILALVAAASLMYYSEVAVAKTNKIKSNIIDGTIRVAGGDSSSGGNSLGASPNSITSTELKAFSHCVTIANKVRGLSRTIVADCLDTAKGNTPGSNSATTFSSSTTSPGAATSNESINNMTSANTKSLSSTELKSFSDCVATARKLQALSHAVVNGCLEEAEGIMH
jgi:hypothetical protein